PQVMAVRLVAPAAAKTTEADAFELLYAQVEIGDARWEWPGRIVIPPHREGSPAAAHARHALDGLVPQVAARNEDIGLAVGQMPDQHIVVGDNQEAKHDSKPPARYRPQLSRS